MKTPTPVKKPAEKYGPGKCKRVEDLPKATVSKENRNETHRPCPLCRQPARREYVYHSQLHDVGDLVSGCPVELPIHLLTASLPEIQSVFYDRLERSLELILILTQADRP